MSKLPAGARKLLEKDPASMSPEEKERQRRELQAILDDLLAQREAIRREYPFWYYEPVTGELTADRRAFLQKWLKPEDIPQRLDGAVAFHQSPKKIRIGSGGNQSTKTYSSVIDNLITATGRTPLCFDPSSKDFKWSIPEKRTARKGPRHVRVIGLDFDNDVLKNLIPKYRDMAPKEFLVEGNFDKSYVAGERTLYLRDGRELLGTIEFMSSKQEPSSFGGPPRHKLSFDEEPPHSVWKENMMRMVTSDNFEAIMSMTPVNGISWTYDSLYMKAVGGDPEVDFFQFVSVANPYSSLDALAQILQELDSYEEIKMRLLGEYISLSGLVYGRLFDPQIHVIEPFEAGCTCGARHTPHSPECPFLWNLYFVGLDPHLTKPADAVFAFMDREDNLYVDQCFEEQVTVEEYKRRIFELSDRKRIDWHVVDRSSKARLNIIGDISLFKILNSRPYRIPRLFESDNSKGSIATGVSMIKDRLKLNPVTKKPRLFIFNRPENQKLIRSFRTLQRDSWANEDARGQREKIAEGLHDHHACLRYIMQRRLRWKPYMPSAPQPEYTDAEAVLM